MKAQLDKVHHTCFQVLAYEPYIVLAERLIIAAALGDFAKKAFFLTTGAEAVENAVKIARSATKRYGHRLLRRLPRPNPAGYGLTGKVRAVQGRLHPFLAEIYHAKFPNELHGVSEADALASIESIFKYDVEADRVAALIIEPVQGDGGFYAISPPRSRRRCARCATSNGIVFIADEVRPAPAGAVRGRPASNKRRARHHHDGQVDGRRLPHLRRHRQGRR